MTRRRTRYQPEEPQRFAQLEPGEPPPDAVFCPTREQPADYTHLVSPAHRRLGWRLRGYYAPQGAGVGAEVYLNIPNPLYPESFMCGKILGHAHAHWIGLRKQNFALPGAPRETAFQPTYEPQVDPWVRERGPAHAARNYLAAALADLTARFRPASHAHIPMASQDLSEDRFSLLEVDGAAVPAPPRDPEQLELPLDQIRRLEID